MRMRQTTHWLALSGSTKMTEGINAITQGAVWAVLLVYFVLPALSDLRLLMVPRLGGRLANRRERR